MIGSLAISLLLAAPAPADDVVVLHVGKILTMNGAFLVDMT